MAAIFRIFIEGELQLSQGTMTSLNFDATTGKSILSRNRAEMRRRRLRRLAKNDCFGLGSKEGAWLAKYHICNRISPLRKWSWRWNRKLPDSVTWRLAV